MFEVIKLFVGFLVAVGICIFSIYKRDEQDMFTAILSSGVSLVAAVYLCGQLVAALS